MRLIAERILERDDPTFLQGELTQLRPVLPAPRAGRTSRAETVPRATPHAIACDRERQP